MSTSPDEIITLAQGLKTALDGCDFIPKASIIDLYQGLERVGSLAVRAKTHGEEETRRWLAGGQP